MLRDVSTLLIVIFMVQLLYTYCFHILRSIPYLTERAKDVQVVPALGFLSSVPVSKECTCM